MQFTERELRAMARLSPARRQAICREVCQDTSRYAYLTAREELGLSDAGMGSLKSRLKKKFHKVADKAKDVAEKVEDAAKRVVNKVEDVAKKVREQVKEVGQQVQKQAKRAGSAVQRIAKETARKAAPVLAIAFPASLAVKSIRKNAANFYRKHGALIVTAVGAVLAPFTYGLSAVAAAALVKGRELYLARKAATEAKKEAKVEAAQMAVAVQQQEASLNEQCDQIYTQTPDSFLAIGLPPERWATLPVDEKLRIIDSLSRGEIPSGYALTSDAKKEAEAVRQQALDEELDKLYSQYQETFDAYGYPPGTWSSMTADQKLAAVERVSAQGSEASSEVAREIPQIQSTAQPATTATASTAPVSTPIPETRTIWYDVMVEGESVGRVSSESQAASLAFSRSSKGDRVEVLTEGRSLGLSIRTDSGLVTVPWDQVASVRALSHGEVVSKVSQATAAAKGAATSGGFPWWLAVVPVALFVGAKAKGA